MAGVAESSHGECSAAEAGSTANTSVSVSIHLCTGRLEGRSGGVI